MGTHELMCTSARRRHNRRTVNSTVNSTAKTRTMIAHQTAARNVYSTIVQVLREGGTGLIGTEPDTSCGMTEARESVRIYTKAALHGT